MHTSVRGIIKNDDGIILIHRIKKNSDVEIRDYYVVPGGKMELNESEEETVKREIFEELGIYVKEGARNKDYWKFIMILMIAYKFFMNVSM